MAKQPTGKDKAENGFCRKDNSMTEFLHIIPAPTTAIMGHVLDTVNVLQLEKKYDAQLIGCSAKWNIVNNQYRVQIFERGRWRGTFPMQKEDLEIYEAN